MPDPKPSPLAVDITKLLADIFPCDDKCLCDDPVTLKFEAAGWAINSVLVTAMSEGVAEEGTRAILLALIKADILHDPRH